MAKQYTTDELIKAWREGERGKFAASQNGTIVILANKSITISGGCTFYITSEDLTVTWTKVQEPVDFVTAINSGKRIKPVDCMARNLHSYQNMDGVLYDLGLLDVSLSKELINGKWLIEDGE